jgi:hypothetical protein
LPRTRLNKSDKDADGFRDLIRAKYLSYHGPAGALELTVVSRAKCDGLIHCFRQRRVQVWWQWAGNGLDACVIDLVQEVLEYGPGPSFQQRERCIEDAALKGRVARNAQRAAERELTVESPRGLQAFGHTAVGGQLNRGQALGFEDVRERTAGTRA